MTRHTPSLSVAKLVVLVAYALAISACQSLPHIQIDQCSAWSPIIPSETDRLTDSTAEQILTHDCVGYRLGCWKSEGMADACPAPQQK